MNKPMKFSLRHLSKIFSWHKQPRASLGIMGGWQELHSPTKELAAATELTGFEGESNLSYISLRDLMPSGRPSKRKRESLTGERAQEEEDDLNWSGGRRPPIKNRLVEQAARAYLLPSGGQRPAPNQFFARYWSQLTVGRKPCAGLICDDLHAPPRGCIRGCVNGCLSCLPSLLWLDLTHAFWCLFSHLRPQSMSLLRA